MERLAIEIGVILLALIVGYRMGFIACFEYLNEEMRKHREWNDGSMGNNIDPL